jgi:hypothetical protein
MTHRSSRCEPELLQLLLDGALPLEEALALELHRTACQECAAEWTSLQEVARAVGSLPPLPPPQLLRERVLREVRAWDRLAAAIEGLPARTPSSELRQRVLEALRPPREVAEEATRTRQAVPEGTSPLDRLLDLVLLPLPTTGRGWALAALTLFAPMLVGTGAAMGFLTGWIPLPPEEMALGFTAELLQLALNGWGGTVRGLLQLPLLADSVALLQMALAAPMLLMAAGGAITTTVLGAGFLLIRSLIDPPLSEPPHVQIHR